MDRALLLRTRSIRLPSTRLAVAVLVATLAVAAGTSWWHASRSDWSSLSTSEREVLAPLADYWQDVSAQERHYYRALAADPALASPVDRAMVSRNLELWHLMTPSEREATRAAFERFRALSPDQRRALVERWDAEHGAMAEDPPVEGEGEVPAAGAEAGADAGAGAGADTSAHAMPPATGTPDAQPQSLSGPSAPTQSAGVPTEKAVIRDAPPTPAPPSDAAAGAAQAR